MIGKQNQSVREAAAHWHDQAGRQPNAAPYLTLCDAVLQALNAGRIRHNNVGLTHKALGDSEQAVTHLERALAIFAETLGEEHPHTRITLNNLASARNR